MILKNREEPCVVSVAGALSPGHEQNGMTLRIINHDVHSQKCLEAFLVDMVSLR